MGCNVNLSQLSSEDNQEGCSSYYEAVVILNDQLETLKETIGVCDFDPECDGEYLVTANRNNIFCMTSITGYKHLVCQSFDFAMVVNLQMT